MGCGLAVFCWANLPYFPAAPRGSKVLDHNFCAVHPVLKLVCSEAFLLRALVIANGGRMSTISCTVLHASSVVILHSPRSQTSEGWRRALSTCASHVAVVSLFFTPCCLSTWGPVSPSLLTRLSMCFTRWSHLSDGSQPIIYSFRNAEVKNAMEILMGGK